MLFPEKDIGVMTEARWKATRDMMVQTKLLSEQAPWQKAFTLDYVNQGTAKP